MLYRLAAAKAPALALTDETPAQRLKVADAWRGWWKDAAAQTDLAKINLDDALQGINVICDETGGGRVWACRADGKPLWVINGTNAWDAQLLPNGHVLIAEHNAGQVTERDLTGKVIWTKTVGNSVTTCFRLPDGNTFIGTFSELMIVDPKGTSVFSYKNPNGGLIARAHRLRNGHLLFACDGNKIVELDAQLKQVRSLNVKSDGDSWISVEPLSGTRFLVAPYGAQHVIELDASGMTIWECKVRTPMSAVRLPNGNTLVGSDQDRAVIEYDRAGKEVWRVKTEGGVRCVRRF